METSLQVFLWGSSRQALNKWEGSPYKWEALLSGWGSWNAWKGELSTGFCCLLPGYRCFETRHLGFPQTGLYWHDGLDPKWLAKMNPSRKCPVSTILRKTRKTTNTVASKLHLSIILRKFLEQGSRPLVLSNSQWNPVNLRTFSLICDHCLIPEKS